MRFSKTQFAQNAKSIKLNLKCWNSIWELKKNYVFNQHEYLLYSAETPGPRFRQAPGSLVPGNNLTDISFRGQGLATTSLGWDEAAVIWVGVAVPQAVAGQGFHWNQIVTRKTISFFKKAFIHKLKQLALYVLRYRWVHNLKINSDWGMTVSLKRKFFQAILNEWLEREWRFVWLTDRFVVAFIQTIFYLM